MPLVQDGYVYFADWSGRVYKVDADTGEIQWERKIERPKTKWPWHGLAGTGALGEGLLFEASVEGTAFAVDADTGDLVWKTRFTDDPQAGNVGKLLYFDGLVYIGVSSVEEPMTKMKEGFVPDFQGKVVALDAQTGRLVWERQLVKAPHNGVAVWSSLALDPRQGILYFTTGNNYTGEATELSDSLIAADAKTGEIIWARQTFEHDVWTPVKPLGPDYDFSGGPQLFEARINGQRRPLVGAAQKSGLFWVFDRRTGQRVWSTSIGYGGVDGGMHGEASLGGGTVLAWSNNGYWHTKPPREHPITIKALDAATGKPLWVKNHAQPAALYSAGFLANDVYFVGFLDGKVRAYRVSDGKRLWTSPSHGPVISSLWVEGETLYFGTGTPTLFGKWAKGPQGVFAYRVEGDVR